MELVESLTLPSAFAHLRLPDVQLIEDALDMRTQQLFHLQKALVLHSGGSGESGDSGAGTDQVGPSPVLYLHRRVTWTKVWSP